MAERGIKSLTVMEWKKGQPYNLSHQLVEPFTKNTAATANTSPTPKTMSIMVIKMPTEPMKSPR